MKHLLAIMFRFVVVATLSLGLHNVVSAADETGASPFPAIVETYMKGWEDFDGEAVAAAVGADGTYTDLFNKRGIRGERLIAYVQSRKGSKLTTVSRAFTDDGKPIQTWNFYDAAGTLVVTGTSTFTLEDGKIKQIVGAW